MILITVYELIQELSRYRAETEVKFHVKAKFTTDVEAEFDRESEDDVQEVTVDAEFDEDVDIDNFEDREDRVFGDVVINFTY